MSTHSFVLGAVALLARKVVSGATILFAATTLIFFSLQLAPGNVIDALVGDAASDVSREAATAEWGLDKPLHEQYANYLARLAHGDLGRSYILSQSVTKVISDRIGPTLELTLTAAVIAVAVAVTVIVLTGTGRPVIARISSLLELILVSTPGFWLGIVLMFIVSFQLGLLPVVGSNGFLTLLLPGATLGLKVAGELIQIMRGAIDRALEEPFALSAKARGISDIGFSLRHGLRHAAIPAITVAGWIVGSLLTGTFVVEQLFGRPGIGTLTVKAVLSRDMPVVMGVSLLAAAAYVGVSSIVDVLCTFIDPRLRHAPDFGKH
ncbi:ABC transporter permease (plasmid) [Microvirga sp. RSM25]|uniref:ABC transporter permease n=1 Tax=Microvirga sp. RSM25 TaxID=3273802 RepID=UPI00384CD059